VTCLRPTTAWQARWRDRRRKEKEKWEVRIKKYKNVSIMNNRHDDIASALPADLDALPRRGKSKKEEGRRQK
jgi:hypothetical protein